MKIFFFYMMAKLNFQQPLLHSSVSHDPSEIIKCWFGGQETFIIIDFENNLAALFWGGGGGGAVTFSLFFHE